MKKIKLFFTTAVAIVLLAMVSGCGGSASSDNQSDYPNDMVSRGETLYNQTCFTCHGPDGRGIPNLGKDLIESEFVSQSSDEELLEYVNTGRATNDPANTTGIAMPAKGGFNFLTDEDILAIIASIRVDLQQ